MTEIVGTGKNGKRLWMRSPDNRWIEVPYGAGQDSAVRSVNIYDAAKKKWMTPTWGWEVWNRIGINTFIPSLDVRAPGRSWKGGRTEHPADQLFPYYNPNYRHRLSNIQFSTMRTDWLRLFYLKERNDPNWRFIPLIGNIPGRVPNQTLNFAGISATQPYTLDAGNFWPVGNYHALALPYPEMTGQVTRGLSNEFAFLLAFGGVSYYDRTVPGQADSVDTRHATTAMIDFKAIRQRLEDKYNEQDTFFTGQYLPISKMKLRRIVLDITCSAGMGVTGPNAPTTVPVVYVLYVYRNAQGVAETVTSPVWEGSYSVRSPVPEPTGGTAIWSASTGTMTWTGGFYRYDHVRDVNIDQYNGWVEQSFQYVIEDPGEDNIAFDVKLEGVPGPTSDRAGGGCQVAATGISLQYAAEGHDLPIELRTKTDWR